MTRARPCTGPRPAANPNFPVIAYRVTPSLAGVPQAPQVFNSGLTSQVVTGLINGGSYSFTVAALDANGAVPNRRRRA